MPDFFTSHDGSKLAYEKLEAAEGNTQPGIIFLCGYRSDMNGSKALYLRELALTQGRAFIRFDYYAHGDSEGNFMHATISHWKKDVLHMIDHLADPNREHVIVGSSMGGWLALLATLERPERIHGLIGIAAAPDFTDKLMYARMSDEQKKTLEEQGYIEEPTEYSSEPYIITKKLIEDGAEHLLLDRDCEISAQVYLLQGKNDPDVPHHWAEKIKKALVKTDTHITYIDDGDHRLSRPQDLIVLQELIAHVSE